MHYSNSIFNTQKRVIRIIMNDGCMDSSCPLFKKLNILPLYSQYMILSSTFVVKNTDAFKKY